jgi:hypothetical protein
MTICGVVIGRGDGARVGMGVGSIAQATIVMSSAPKTSGSEKNCRCENIGAHFSTAIYLAQTNAKTLLTTHPLAPPFDAWYHTTQAVTYLKEEQIE